MRLVKQVNELCYVMLDLPGEYQLLKAVTESYHSTLQSCCGLRVDPIRYDTIRQFKPFGAFCCHKGRVGIVGGLGG